MLYKTNYFLFNLIYLKYMLLWGIRNNFEGDFASIKSKDGLMNSLV